MVYLVVVSNILDFQPCLGKIPILTNIFRMGWNHQLYSLLMFIIKKQQYHTPRVFANGISF